MTVMPSTKNMTVSMLRDARDSAAPDALGCTAGSMPRCHTYSFEMRELRRITIVCQQCAFLAFNSLSYLPRHTHLNRKWRPLRRVKARH